MFVVLLFGCTTSPSPTALVETSTAQFPTPLAASPTSEPTPTSTPMPVAAIVNGEPIFLSYFEHEVQRYRASLDPKIQLPTDAEVNQIVLDSLVDQALLSQAARANDFSLDEVGVQARIDDLVAQLGSNEALSQWMLTNFYDDSEFRMALKLAAEAAWQRDQIAASVPEKVEQAHVRQIITQTQDNAEIVLLELGAGTDFDFIAVRYSPLTGGELGWFPRGYLNYPEIEEAAFTLPVGSYSQVISTEIGYHIIKVIERDSDHPLTTDALISLQKKALSDWLGQARSAASIEVSLP
jgi:peptidyl-prolyl cis-trans isomerase C